MTLRPPGFSGRGHEGIALRPGKCPVPRNDLEAPACYSERGVRRKSENDEKDCTENSAVAGHVAASADAVAAERVEGAVCPPGPPVAGQWSWISGLLPEVRGKEDARRDTPRLVSRQSEESKRTAICAFERLADVAAKFLDVLFSVWRAAGCPRLRQASAGAASRTKTLLRQKMQHASAFN